MTSRLTTARTLAGQVGVDRGFKHTGDDCALGDRRSCCWRFGWLGQGHFSAAATRSANLSSALRSLSFTPASPGRWCQQGNAALRQIDDDTGRLEAVCANGSRTDHAQYRRAIGVEWWRHE